MKAKLHDIKNESLKNDSFRMDFLEQTNPGDIIYSSINPKMLIA